jgi:hypothetical protein
MFDVSCGQTVAVRVIAAIMTSLSPMVSRFVSSFVCMHAAFWADWSSMFRMFSLLRSFC